MTEVTSRTKWPNYQTSCSHWSRDNAIGSFLDIVQEDCRPPSGSESECGFVIFWCWLRSSVKVWWQCGSVLVRHLVRAQCPIQCGWTSQERRGGTRRRGGCRGCWQPPLIPIHLSPTLWRLTILSTVLLRHCVLLPLNGVARLKGLGVALHQSAGQCLVSHCPPCILERAAPPKLPHSRHCADTNPVSQHHTQTSELATILSVLEYF